MKINLLLALLTLIMIIDLACGTFSNLKSYSEKIGINPETFYLVIVFIIVISIINIIMCIKLLFTKNKEQEK